MKDGKDRALRLTATVEAGPRISTLHRCLDKHVTRLRGWHMNGEHVLKGQQADSHHIMSLKRCQVF
jgi:hypothetical protein